LSVVSHDKIWLLWDIKASFMLSIYFWWYFTARTGGAWKNTISLYGTCRVSFGFHWLINSGDTIKQQWTVTILTFTN
jgi:hypothetical protein